MNILVFYVNVEISKLFVSQDQQKQIFHLKITLVICVNSQLTPIVSETNCYEMFCKRPMYNNDLQLNSDIP